MIIEPQMFPSDVNGVLGSLRKELTKSLHRSTYSKDAYQLVKETLKVALELLDEAKKETETNAKALAKKQAKLAVAAAKIAEEQEVLKQESPLFNLFMP